MTETHVHGPFVEFAPPPTLPLSRQLGFITCLTEGEGI
jgi:hypothetical protein